MIRMYALVIKKKELFAKKVASQNFGASAACLSFFPFSSAALRFPNCTYPSPFSMTVAEGFTENDDVEMAIAAPPRSYTATPLKGISPFEHGHATPEPVSFAVPNDFSDASVQKGLKSNSWFTSASSFGSEKTVRRIASAPNAKLLNMTKQQQQQQQGSFHSLRLHSTGAASANGSMISVPALERLRSCRRTYSSSSIKVKKVQVGPSSFTKIRMLGKGDVGKVYMVRQKGSDRLDAMKGKGGSTITTTIF